MASPQSTTSQDDAAGSNKLEQITFRFCSECSNMLYPKEDKDAHSLQFTCRTCQYTEEASSSCVFRNVLNNSAGETAGVTQDVGSDPTVSDVPPVLCLTCGTVILCGLCSQPAAYMALIKREDSQDSDPGFANFVLAGSADPLAEYDEYFDDDDAATAASGDVPRAETESCGTAVDLADLGDMAAGALHDGPSTNSDDELLLLLQKSMHDVPAARGSDTVPHL